MMKIMTVYFAVKGNDEGEFRPVCTISTHEKLQGIAMADHEIRIRLESMYDAIDGDSMYHSVCLLNHTRKSGSDMIYAKYL